MIGKSEVVYQLDCTIFLGKPSKTTKSYAQGSRHPNQAPNPVRPGYEARALTRLPTPSTSCDVKGKKANT
jgi:hypothetical protein